MKEKIKLLAEQAKLPDYVLKYGTELCLAPHLEKFAELIVRECAKVVDDKLDFENASGPDGWASGDDLMKHFGVE